MMHRCPKCGAVAWNESAIQTHILNAHLIPELCAPLKLGVMQGVWSDWACQAPTHAQAQLSPDYRAVISWQDEIRYILDEKYGLGGQAA